MSEKLYKRNTIFNSNANFFNLKNYIIKIAQWNILAQGFIEVDKYQYCSSSDLSLMNRLALFRKEFNYINADIYCLQEADIHEILCNIMNERGDRYLGIFVEKTNSNCLLFPNNYGSDGCSIIYNKEKVSCLDQCSFKLDETHVCLFGLFGFKFNTEVKFIVVSTHLKSKREYEAQRKKQFSMMLSKLKFLMSQWQTISVFICGDFNAPPDEVIRSLQHSFLNLVDVYDELKMQSNNEQHFTTWRFQKSLPNTKNSDQNFSSSSSTQLSPAEYKDIIDYIWYVPSLSDFLENSPAVKTKIVAISILQVPEKEEIGMYGIPSIDKYPSDHFSLVADFFIKTS